MSFFPLVCLFGVAILLVAAATATGLNDLDCVWAAVSTSLNKEIRFSFKLNQKLFYGFILFEWRG